MLKKISVLMLFVGVICSPITWVIADEASDIKNITEIFSQIVPDRKAEIISPSFIPGMYEVVYGAQVMYMSADARYVIQGDVIDLKNRENITETLRSKQRQRLIKTLDESDMIVFKPKGEEHYRITVFTDIDCGYCRKLHREMADYLAEGITVRYMAFPRSGVNTKSYFKAVNVWCAADKHAAMTKAKAGQSLPKKTCKNPVAEQMALGEDFGVTGTPTIVFDNGEVVPGYVPAIRLHEILEKTKKAAAL